MMSMKNNQFNDKNLKEEVGKRLKERRLELQMTQRQVAAQLGIAQPVYQRFEKGTFECSYAQLVSICKLFDISADYVLGISDY